MFLTAHLTIFLFYTASRYNLYYEYIEKESDNQTVKVKVKEEDLVQGSVDDPLEAMELVTLVFEKSHFNQTQTQYLMYVEAEDDKHNVADPSNIARWCQDCYSPQPEEDTGLTGGQTVAILFGVMAFVALTAALFYFLQSRGCLSKS